MPWKWCIVPLSEWRPIHHFYCAVSPPFLHLSALWHSLRQIINFPPVTPITLQDKYDVSGFEKNFPRLVSCPGESRDRRTVASPKSSAGDASETQRPSSCREVRRGFYFCIRAERWGTEVGHRGAHVRANRFRLGNTGLDHRASAVQLARNLSSSSRICLASEIYYRFLLQCCIFVYPPLHERN